MKEDVVDLVLKLYKESNWKAISDTCREHPDRSRLLWVFPTEGNLRFIQSCLKELGCDDVLSIGCGSGLLEWILTEATGIPVSGLEMDGAWWRCKHAPPSFIPLLFTTPTLDKDTIDLLHSNSTALLFCYFNNRPAFEQYLKNYSGSVLIIIGPEDGKGVHTDPRPFGDVTDDWVLFGSQEVGASKDFIAVYRKQVSE